MKKLAAVGLAGALAAVSIAAPSIAGGNKYDKDTNTVTCEDMVGESGTVTLIGPETLWPPNHKFVQEPITATATDPAANVVLEIFPDGTEAVSGGDGGSNHDPDAQVTNGDKSFVSTGTGTATSALELRAERSGKGVGRTYVIGWTADFGGRSCASESQGGDYPDFEVFVPHDMRGGADWK